MRFEDMTPEMIEKVRECETAEERKTFLEENGIELTNEQLEGIAGGAQPSTCPKPEVGTPDYCLRNPSTEHEWSNTGITSKFKPGKVMLTCLWCGRKKWVAPGDPR